MLKFLRLRAALHLSYNTMSVQLPLKLHKIYPAEPCVLPHMLEPGFDIDLPIFDSGNLLQKQKKSVLT